MRHCDTHTHEQANSKAFAKLSESARAERKSAPKESESEQESPRCDIASAGTKMTPKLEGANDNEAQN